MYIGVVCMFFYLIKFTLWLLHIFYPIISLLLHVVLAGLWAASIYIQTAPDTADPAHENKGAPWYITKSCNIVSDKTERGYCMQAKSAFAVSIIMLYVFLPSPLQHAPKAYTSSSITYVIFIILSIWSLVPTAEARLAHDTKVAEKKAEKELYAASAYDQDMTPEEQWQHMWELQQLPRTPGTATGNLPWSKVPVTPRTRAFNELQGGGPEYYQQPMTPQHPPPQTYYPPPQGHEDVGYAGVAPHGQQELDEYIYDGKGKGTAV